MSDSEKSDSRVLVEVQLSDGAGAMFADGRFVLELKDGIGRLVEVLRPLQHPLQSTRLDLRISELLERSEREELEQLRRTVRDLRHAAEVAE